MFVAPECVVLGDRDREAEDGRLLDAELFLGGIIFFVPPEYSVQPKPLFWFRSDTETETQIVRYFRPIP